jgi:hypothetical protein
MKPKKSNEKYKCLLIASEFSVGIPPRREPKSIFSSSRQRAHIDKILSLSDSVKPAYQLWHYEKIQLFQALSLSSVFQQFGPATKTPYQRYRRENLIS